MVTPMVMVHSRVLTSTRSPMMSLGADYTGGLFRRDVRPTAPDRP
jgi:hypothetical protein